MDFGKTKILQIEIKNTKNEWIGTIAIDTQTFDVKSRFEDEYKITISKKEEVMPYDVVKVKIDEKDMR